MLPYRLLRHRALAYFALLIAVFIWGVNFNVVKEAMKSWRDQPFTFLAARFWLAALIYAVLLTVRNRSVSKAFTLKSSAVLQASLVGFVLAAGYGLQTWYLVNGGAVSAAFLTSTTVLWAPLLAFLFGQKFYISTLIGGFVALIGIFIMEVAHNDYGTAGWMDLVAISAAVAFAIEILLVSRFAPKDKSIQWTTISCLNVALIMTVPAIIHEDFNWHSQISQRIFAIIFTGVFATAIALGLQNWAQAQEINQKKIIDGPRAAIISALEPVFTTLVAVFVVGSRLPAKLAAGCFLILVGTLISEFAAAKRSQLEDPAPPSIGMMDQ